MYRIGARKEGQILAVFAAALVVIVLVVGLALDAGNVFLQRRGGQNSADIGAMAGTKRMFDYYVSNPQSMPAGAIYAAINQRMTENNCPGGASSCTWTAHYVGPRAGANFVDMGVVAATDTAPPTVGGQKALGIKVDVRKTPQTYLLGIMGQSEWVIDTSATAITGSLTNVPVGPLLPIAMVGFPTQEGTIYALTSGANGPGNFGWLTWDGSPSAPTLGSSICIPDSPALNLPELVDGDPGKSNSSEVRGCLQKYVDSQQVVLIPIVLKTGDTTTGSNGQPCTTGGRPGNNFNYCVVGVAAFVLTSYSQPAVDQINGRFVGTIPYSIGSTVPGGVTAPPSATNGAVNLLGLAQ